MAPNVSQFFTKIRKAASNNLVSLSTITLFFMIFRALGGTWRLNFSGAALNTITTNIAF